MKIHGVRWANPVWTWIATAFVVRELPHPAEQVERTQRLPAAVKKNHYCSVDLCARISLGIILPGPQHSSGSRGVVLGFYCFLLSHKFKGTVMVRHAQM